MKIESYKKKLINNKKLNWSAGVGGEGEKQRLGDWSEYFRGNSDE